MQRERLEGWMVKQIEHADLAKETVIQLPMRATAPKSPLFSPRTSAMTAASPRRCRPLFGHLPKPERPYTSVDPSHSPHRAPADHIQRHCDIPRTSLKSAVSVVGELEDEDSVARQWRLHFQDPEETFIENGPVDRRQVLRTIQKPMLSSAGSPRKTTTGHPEQPNDDDEYEETDETADERDFETAPASTLILWGMPREYILEYIRQSVMPVSRTTHAHFTGEWEAVTSEGNGRYTTKEPTDRPGMLPPLTTHSVDTTSSTKSPQPDSTALHGRSRTAHIHHGITVALKERRPYVSPTSRRLQSRKGEERIQRVLNELRSDPTLWEAFQKQVKAFIEGQRTKQKSSNRIKENKQQAKISPRAPEVLALRKKKHDERCERVRLQHERILSEEDSRLEQMMVVYRQKTQGIQDSKTPDITTTVHYRRRRMWLLATAFVNTTLVLQARLREVKQRHVLELMQTTAARVIQRMWRKLKLRQASQHTIIVYTWLRKCLWKLMFRVRVRRRIKHAMILQRFMLDNFSGSRETRDFDRMMHKWRHKVISSQRNCMAFIMCTRARMIALSHWWDRIDHERQRMERHQYEKMMAMADGTESRIVANRKSSRMPSHSWATQGVGAHVSNLATIMDSGSVAPGLSSSFVSALMTTTNTRTTQLLMFPMDGKSQQAMTPMELQRSQQNAYHIVKIPKTIKMRLLQAFLTAARKDYIHQLTKYHEQVITASYAREVKIDDARAIVQKGGSWGSLLSEDRTGGAKPRRPIFQLYAPVEKQRKLIEEIVRRGVHLTLESDPDQRALVERQQLHRGFETSVAMGTNRRRKSTTPTPPATPGSSENASTTPRRSSRKITFTLPSTNESKILKG